MEIRLATEEETQAKREEGAERLAKIASELRSLHRAEQNAGFEMGRLLCEVAGTTYLKINLPRREDRFDVALWAKREVSLTYSNTAYLMNIWRVKDALGTSLMEPGAANPLRPLIPLLKHKHGRELINAIWERACAESNRKEGPSRSLVAKIAKQEAPEIVGKKKPPKSGSKQKALAAVQGLADKYERRALVAALTEYLKKLSDGELP